MKNPKLLIDGNSLDLRKIALFLRKNPLIVLSKGSQVKIERTRRLVDKWVETGRVIYGVTTGFGEFANVNISGKNLEMLQERLIVSHSAGVGEKIPGEIVKLMMILRINALAKGHSGIRNSTLKLLLDMLNGNIIPVIPSQGSVGSSGDLAPLAHMVLSMIGKGKVEYTYRKRNTSITRIMNSGAALRRAGLHPVRLHAKEGLALINGTQMMTAYAAYICVRAIDLLKIADIAGALSHEALRGTDRAFDPRLHRLRPYKGQKDSAQNLLRLIENSEIRKSHLENDSRVQDSYSLRCIPQIHGASRDTVDFISGTIEIEMNSANDNPLIFYESKDLIEGGNFHGQPVALAMDFMAIALSELASVSERRTERMLNGSLSSLPRFLVKQGGLNSGLMIAQYTAASLVSENKVLCHPASVDSIPTSANQEDHNSMGSIAAQKCLKVLRNVQLVLAIELFTAAQALEFLKPLKCGKGTAKAYKTIRKFVPVLNKDRVISDNINTVNSLIENGTLLKEVEKDVRLQ